MRKLTIGVMGSAGGDMSEELIEKCKTLGQAVAEAGWAMITGGCPGLPHYAAIGCDEAGGLTIGVSPAISEAEHVNRYGSPTDHLDLMIYTGAGLMGREVTSVRSCDIVIIIGGRSGTLGEFAIAYDEGRPIGVLTGTGGLADHIDEILPIIRKDTGSRITYDADPVQLVARCIQAYLDDPPMILEREASA